MYAAIPIYLTQYNRSEQINMTIEQILTIVASFSIGILSTVVTGWAKKGSHFCDAHHNLSAKIDLLAQKVDDLIYSGTKLVDKFEGYVNTTIALDKEVAIIKQRVHDKN